MSPTTHAAAPAGSTTDRIEKRLELSAPRSRVWRALANAKEFGEWFGMTVDGEFTEGATIRGKITVKGNEHVVMFQIEKIQPEKLFSYRWHPGALDPTYDYSVEPMTLVEFRLEEAKGGSVVTIVETGFDKIPLARRDSAFRMNSGGWDSQGAKLVTYVG